MAKLATFSPEGPKDPAHTTILHSTEDERNVSQIGMLLEIRNESSRFLMSNPSIGTAVEFDTEAVKDARETYTLAGYALRNIIDTTSRWDLSKNEIDVKTAAVLDLKIREHENRIETQAKIQAPSALYRTQLRKIELPSKQMKWVCWLGGVDPTHTDCHGLGDTPQEACQAFDVMFTQLSAQTPMPQAAPLETQTELPLEEKPKE